MSPTVRGLDPWAADPAKYVNEHLMVMLKALGIEFDEDKFKRSRLSGAVLATGTFGPDKAAFVGMDPTDFVAFQSEFVQLCSAFAVSGQLCGLFADRLLMGVTVTRDAIPMEAISRPATGSSNASSSARPSSPPPSYVRIVTPPPVRAAAAAPAVQAVLPGIMPT